MGSVLDVVGRFRIALAGVAALFTACGGSDGPGGTMPDGGPQMCRADGWCLYVVDGSRFNVHDPSLGSVSGSSGSDVVAVGWTGQDAAILHFDGTSWQLTTEPTDGALEGVWVYGAGASWAVGYKGETFRTTPAARDQSTIATTNLWQVWGASPTDVWAVGDGGTTLHGDGATWTPVTTTVSAQLIALAGTSTTDVWTAGSNATLLHRTGGGWTSVDPGLAGTFTALWFASSTDGWLASDSGQLAHYNGASWSVMAGPALGVHALWGSSSTDVWAVGGGLDTGGIAHWDGTAWTLATSPGDFQSLASVWGSSASDVWAVGDTPAGSTSFQIWHYSN